MRSDIEFLEHIFDQMKEAGLVGSKGEFSKALLGKGASYLTSMAARDRIVPMEVLDYMSLQLLNRAEQSRIEISEMEAKLCGALAKANREADICDHFEEFSRCRLAMELGGGESSDACPARQSTARRFVGMIPRWLGMDPAERGKTGKPTKATSAVLRPLH